MSSEDQEILARISQLAGQINRRKNEQAGFQPSQPARHSYRQTRASTGIHRGHGSYRVAKSLHRNRSLVLNGAASSSKSDIDSGATSDASTTSWVTKTDRHLQLINTNVFEKETKARVKAIEQTRIQNFNKVDQREQAKLLTHLAYSGTAPSQQSPTVNNYEVVVDGIRFRVTKNGSKLVRFPGPLSPGRAACASADGREGENNLPKATPKVASVGGVKFYRSKNGNLYRHGVVKAKRRFGAVKKVNEPCRSFSTTGSCSKGPACRYIHDASRVAACKDLLQKGECVNGDDCDLSHDLTPQRTPSCLHFAKGNCTNPNCPYAHVKVAPGAPVCRRFGIYGFCEAGADCPDRHSYECPDFSNTGTCKTKGCKLLHRERASVLRKATSAAAAAQRDGQNPESAVGGGDLSSDDGDNDEDGESINSDDLDSDEVEEFVGQHGDDDGLSLEFANQNDFIKL